MKTRILITLTLVFSALFFVTCKKGEDDPVISLSSRKARLEGSWTLEKAELTLGSKDSVGAYSAKIYVLDKSNYNLSNTFNGSSFSGPSSLSLSFSKDGIFTLSQELEGKKLEASGTWDFQGKVGKNKNKEKFNVHLNTVKGNSGWFALFNKGAIDFNYSIKELRSKKLVLKCEEEMVLLDNSGGVYITSEYTFVQ